MSTKQHKQLKQVSTKRSNRTCAGVQIRTIFLGSAITPWAVPLAIATLINSLILHPPAWAQTPKLGVVKSLDNANYWPQITKRLQATGVDYCIIDFAQVQEVSDLGKPKLLLLPNIERLEALQLAALQTWMRQGGRVIVTGPAGNLSQPEVRTQLRTLLGAYWGFPLKKPYKLELAQTDKQTWVRQARTASIWGGVVIPTDLNASAAAVWSQTNNSPAVVTTDKSTFFGWRWGLDAIAPPAVDSAWLRAALSRYKLAPTPARSRTNSSPTYCVPASGSTANIRQTPRIEQSVRDTSTTKTASSPTIVAAETDPDFGIAPARVLPNTQGRITAAQVSVMTQEIKNLIERVESTLLAANATNSNVNLPTSAAIDQFLVASAKGGSGSENTQTAAVGGATNSIIRAVDEAKMGLQNFLNAVEQKDYDRARQQWFQARRILWENYPIDRKLAQPEIRAIWLDRKTIVAAKSEQDLAKLFDQLAAAGLNTVFFETVNASYPIYPSRVAPEQNPLVKGWDPLASAVKLAHERKMELHAWVWMFAGANQRHNTILNQPANYPGPLLKALPDWAMFDTQGRLFDPITKKAFLDPANPAVRRYLVALLEEIVTRYQVDGIQLDYIRYPFQNPRVNQTYGYGKAARQQFIALTGIDPIQISPSQRELWQKWTDFRIQQIDSFVATVSTRLRAKRPSLILSAAVFPIPRLERLQRLQQNWENWAMRGDIDLIVPMTYALDTPGLEHLAQPVLMQSTLSSALILPGIRLLNVPSIVAVDQIQLLRDLPTSGYALFAVENFDANLGSILRRTQGVGENVSSSSYFPIPYRQPFPAAAARYAGLQKEWSFLLATHQIVIREPALSEWGKQADILSTLLERLAKDPSMTNLLAAKTFLISFRSQFPRWMQQQATMQPYQVQVWDNRLLTIERLLHYGERRVLNQ